MSSTTPQKSCRKIFHLVALLPLTSGLPWIIIGLRGGTVSAMPPPKLVSMNDTLQSQFITGTGKEVYADICRKHFQCPGTTTYQGAAKSVAFGNCRTALIALPAPFRDDGQVC